jgi:Trk K+ transport system NAD-binding subunit
MHCILMADSTGDNRLAVAVASKLVEGDATVVLVAGGDQREAGALRDAVIASVGEPSKRAAIEARALTSRPVVAAVALGQPRDVEHGLRKAVAMGRANCLLALSGDAEQNLRAAVVARRVAGGLRVVLRSFDPDFAHQLERAPSAGRYVERAYSVAHLSAPSFVAAALLDDPTAHQLTMRVGVEYISVYRIALPERDTDATRRLRRGRKRGLLGRTPNEIVRDEGCQVLARRSAERWEWVEQRDVPLEAGEQILLGGPMTDVLSLALGRSAMHGRRHGHSRHRRLAAAWSDLAARSARRGRTQRPVARAISRARERVASTSLSTRVTVGLGLIMTVATLWLSLGHGLGKWFYQWVGTALGNAGDTTESGSRDVVAAVGLATGGIMLGLLTSMMSAWFVRERIVEDVRRRARRMKRHVIIVGLDDIGMQVAALLRKLDVRSTVVVPGSGSVESLAPDGRVQRLSKHTPILTGELLEMLDHAQIDRARAVVACSEDNLVNVQACMRAKRGDGPNGIRMIARIFNDEDAETAAATFQIDHHIAAVDEAAPAFVDAALNDGARGLRDPHGALRLRSVVWHGERCIKRAEMEDWQKRGIRMLAVLRGRDLQTLPVEPQSLACGQLAVLAGPEAALRKALRRAR